MYSIIREDALQGGINYSMSGNKNERFIGATSNVMFAHQVFNEDILRRDQPHRFMIIPWWLVMIVGLAIFVALGERGPVLALAIALALLQFARKRRLIHKWQEWTENLPGRRYPSICFVRYDTANDYLGDLDLDQAMSVVDIETISRFIWEVAWYVDAQIYTTPRHGVHCASQASINEAARRVYEVYNARGGRPLTKPTTVERKHR